MENAMDFDTINFNPTNQELTIKDGSTTVFGPTDLSSTAVKLQVADDNGQLQVCVETASAGTWSVDTFELSIKYSGTSNDANLYFGTLDDVCTTSLGNNETIGADDKYHTMWIGADDVRNNVISPKGVLLMEGEIISFEIVDDFLAIRYHDSITPDE